MALSVEDLRRMGYDENGNRLPKQLATPEKTEKKANKYRNRKVEVNGTTFDSEKEANRYGELLILEKAGEIKDLKCQVKFELVVNGERVCNYIADFCFTNVETNELIVEDIKSIITRRLPVYRIKNKLMKACHGIIITEK